MPKSTKSTDTSLSHLDKARLIAGWLKEKKARDVKALDVSGLCPVTEALVLASAGSTRQAQALADWLMERSAEQGVPHLGREGYRPGHWILVDLNDVIVHLFLDEIRTFYNIEGLWSEGRVIELPDEPSA